MHPVLAICTLSIPLVPVASPQATKSEATAEKRAEEATTTSKPTDKEKRGEQGLQHRLIGPFCGDRSLTGVGFPGQPSLTNV